MSLKKVVELAEQQGYHFQKCDWANLDHAFVNPKFWQALARARGFTYGLETGQWKDAAHQYLDAKFNGTEEEFWKELIKQ